MSHADAVFSQLLRYRTVGNRSSSTVDLAAVGKAVYPVLLVPDIGKSSAACPRVLLNSSCFVWFSVVSNTSIPPVLCTET